MAHLTKPAQYNIEDSNIALLGSDLEKRVREHAGDKEAAWAEAGLKPGLDIWRIEKFKVVAVPTKLRGTFYSGDSYIVLHTYKKSGAETLSYDLHFWLGTETSQDEAGTAAYKTTELDDHLHGVPIQYREAQGFESTKFLSYFPSFHCLKGGVATGFHHVSQQPPPNEVKMYHITSPASSVAHSKNVVVREVPANGSSLRGGDVFVLDRGTECLQFNMKGSSGKERFKAADFVRTIADARPKCAVHVYEEGAPGAGTFLAAIGISADAVPHAPSDSLPARASHLHSLSSLPDGQLTVADVTPSKDSLVSSAVFALDVADPPAVYVWVGKAASDNERKSAVHLGQMYLHQQAASHKATPVIRVTEGSEPESFFKALSS